MITPYASGQPRPFDVAYVTEPGCFTGNNAVLYASRKQARTWAIRGYGELLVWNSTPIQWQHDGRTVYLLHHPPPDAEAADGLDAWAEWVRSSGARCASVRSTSRSLLRASLAGREPIPVATGEPPPIPLLCGGREEMGPAGQGSFGGPVLHYDQRASYASRIGATPYGRWWTSSTGEDWRELPPTVPAFAHARVTVPGYSARTHAALGPLVRRPRSDHERKRRAFERAARRALPEEEWGPDEYPTGARVQGIWTTAELDMAEAHGCTVLVDRTWHQVALPHEQPFRWWWSLIEEGRELPGFAGTLAKQTGNTLWSSFALSPGDLVAYSWHRGKLRKRNRELPGKPAVRDHDIGLAEWITGTGRAVLHEAMTTAGDLLVCAHTDGVWVVELGEPWRPPTAGWRLKEVADAIDVLSPAHLCYRRPGSSRPLYTYAGEETDDAPAAFEEKWRSARLGKPLAHRRPKEEVA